MSSRDSGTGPGPRSRRRAGALSGWRVIPLLALLVALVGGGAGTASTFAANFSAQTRYDTTLYPAAKLTAPTTLTATPAGSAVTLGWTPASTRGTHQVVGYDDTGASTTCSAADTFTVLTASLTATVAAFHDTAAATRAGTTPGDYACYQVSTAYKTSWTTSAYKRVQVGFVVTKTTLKSTTTTPVTIKKTTTVVLTFNQPLGAKPTAHAVVCTFATPTNEVYLGDTTAYTSGICNTTDSVNFGVLQSSVALTNSERYAKLTYTLGSSTTKLTLKITTAPVTLTHVAASAVWTFTPSSSLLSATGTVPVCNSNTHTSVLCDPQAAKNF